MKVCLETKMAWMLRLHGDVAGGSVATVPVTINELLLRGCTLKNSGRVHGLVVYTGPESRIQMNAASPPRKVGARPSRS